jgi:hypothetical protein
MINFCPRETAIPRVRGDYFRVPSAQNSGAASSKILEWTEQLLHRSLVARLAISQEK